MRGELQSHYESIMGGEGRGGVVDLHPSNEMKIRNLEKLRAGLIVFFSGINGNCIYLS